MSTAALVLGERLPASGTIDLSSFDLLQSGATTYLELDAKGARRGTLTITRSATEEHGAAIAVAEGDDRTQFLARAADGDIVMTAVIERPDNAITFFDPALVIAFGELRPGKERASEGEMRVMYLSNPSRQREHGTAHRTMTYAGDQRIATPRGEFMAHRIEIHFTADLGLADVDERTTQWIVPGRGIVAETSREQVKILGAFSRTRERTLVRAD